MADYRNLKEHRAHRIWIREGRGKLFGFVKKKQKLICNFFRDSVMGEFTRQHKLRFHIPSTGPESLRHRHSVGCVRSSLDDAGPIPVLMVEIM